MRQLLPARSSKTSPLPYIYRRAIPPFILGLCPRYVCCLDGILGSSLCMPSKHTNRNRKGFRSLPIDENSAVGTPASNAVTKDDFNSVVDSDIFAISMDALWGMRDHTANQGPIVVGVAHGDYTAAEIEECLEAVASWDSGDKVEQERRRRKVRQIGIFPGLDADEVLNHGVKIRTKLGFVLQVGETLSLWTWNRAGVTLTTGTIITLQGLLHSRKI